MKRSGNGITSALGRIFFIFCAPLTFIEWIIKYANGRTIIDIGAGRLMALSKAIYNKGYHKIIAIENAAKNP